MQRWERRARKLESERARMPKHGQTLAALYATAVRKRAATVAPPEVQPGEASAPAPPRRRRRRRA